jgi:hypothetical protein
LHKFNASITCPSFGQESNPTRSPRKVRHRLIAIHRFISIEENIVVPSHKYSDCRNSQQRRHSERSEESLFALFAVTTKFTMFAPCRAAQEDYPKSCLAASWIPNSKKAIRGACPRISLLAPCTPSGGATSVALVKMIFFGSLNSGGKDLNITAQRFWCTDDRCCKPAPLLGANSNGFKGLLYKPLEKQVVLTSPGLYGLRVCTYKP